MMKRLFTFSPRAKGVSNALLLVLERQQVRLLRLESGLLRCVAEGPTGSPEQHSVGQYLNELLRLGFRGPLRVVIGTADQRVALETLPKASRSDLEHLLRQRLADQFPDTELHTAQALPGQGSGAQRYRLMAVASWPALDAWLAWLADLSCRLQGPYLSSALAADALVQHNPGRTSPHTARHRLVLVRSAEGGAMLLVLTAGVLRLVRHLDPVVCGSASDVEVRAQALLTLIDQTRQWLQQQDTDTAEALLLNVLDEPEVVAHVAELCPSDTDDGKLSSLCETLNFQHLPPQLLGDAVTWASLKDTHTRPLAPLHWINRRSTERHSRQLAWAASVVIGVATATLAWQGLALRDEHLKLQSAQKVLTEEKTALAQSQARRNERDQQLQTMAGAQELSAFEQRAQAYRALLQGVDAHEQTTELLRAVGEAISRSSLTLQSLRISHEAQAAAPLLELGFAPPSNATRADAIAEIRHVTGLLQQNLPRHEVSTSGIEGLRNTTAPSLPDPFAELASNPATRATAARKPVPASPALDRPAPAPGATNLIQVRVERKT